MVDEPHVVGGSSKDQAIMPHPASLNRKDDRCASPPSDRGGCGNRRRKVHMMATSREQSPVKNWDEKSLGCPVVKQIRRACDRPIALYRHRVALPGANLFFVRRQLEPLLVTRCHQCLQLLHGSGETVCGKSPQDIIGWRPTRGIEA